MSVSLARSPLIWFFNESKSLQKFWIIRNPGRQDAANIKVTPDYGKNGVLQRHVDN
jgi:hypothetical protein